MSFPTLYTEATDAGLTRREASWVAFAHDLSEMLRGVREEQTAFLESIGLSWEEARVLDEAGRASLNKQWMEYQQNRP